MGQALQEEAQLVLIQPTFFVHSPVLSQNPQLPFLSASGQLGSFLSASNMAAVVPQELQDLAHWIFM